MTPITRASACRMGKGLHYAPGADGYRGVRTAIEITRKELDVSMALTGITNLGNADRTILAVAESER